MTLSTVLENLNPVKPVDREEQIQEFRSALDDRIRVLGSVFQTLYEWYGGPGIGKSTLLGLLMNECQDAHVPYSFIDFNTERASAYKEDVIRLVEDFLENFGGVETDTVDATIAIYRQVPIEESERRQLRRRDVARAFVRLIRDLVKRDPVVLFFDETERVDQDVVAWLEEWMINPLVQNGRCLIVWAGRRPQRWRRFEVRRRVRIQKLGVFDEKSTEKLFKENSDYPLTGLAPKVRGLTLGHPKADTIVLRYLDVMAQAGQSPEKEQFDRIEADLLSDLVQKFVDNFAFKGLPENVVTACRVMSLVRQFDVIMLREVLKETVTSFSEFRRDEFGDLLSQLRGTQLVLWDDRRKGYAIDSTLRHILSEHIRRHSPDIYARVNRVAIRVYRDWIQRAGDNRGVYIVEELYQQACLNQTPGEIFPEEKIKPIEVLAQRIQEYSQRDPDLRASALDRLYHELEDDPDLPKLIGQDGLEQLLQLVRKARVSVYDI